MASIEIEAKEKGLNLENLLAGVPVKELTEEDGQKALVAIRALARQGT